MGSTATDPKGLKHMSLQLEADKDCAEILTLIFSEQCTRKNMHSAFLTLCSVMRKAFYRSFLSDAVA